MSWPRRPVSIEETLQMNVCVWRLTYARIGYDPLSCVREFARMRWQPVNPPFCYKWLLGSATTSAGKTTIRNETPPARAAYLSLFHINKYA
ncbi:hypothetical protein Y032_0032g2573 [Ancylostoma ceylanicum]|nr:hypothetical protein Y032_0032g2573 [Ancylostoma ceylanicum]